MSFRHSKFRKKSSSFRIRRRGRVGFVLFFFLIGVVFYSVWSMERSLEPILLVIAKAEVKKIAQDAMLEGIREVEHSLGGDLNKTINIERDNQGNITFVQVNSQVQAQIYERITTKIQEELKNLQNKPIDISVGQVLQSNVFAEYGPDIPIDMWPKGSAKVSIIPKMESKGINMVMITLQLKVQFEMGVVIPFSENSLPVDIDYPIAQAMVVGEVPQYYFYNDHQGAIQKGVPPLPPIPAIQQQEKKDPN
ncbi:sporulation protein YunB [Hazenella coriacea]|uniref:Sporulation protein YunB n=1 Tax=Hazenella coriacea TaxID=1179467 RepID=A0A4R3LCD4_9BACL|nr:sporulation protein YunB [Hazenella coriacea]TCS96940.1 sporulation protein YunB [Hazenella coriacea]